MERKLASIQKIDNLSPIEGADLIEVATIKGWKLVVKKGEFTEGENAIYCEIEQVQVFTAQKKILEDQKKQKVDDINLYQNAGIE